ncbi:MAG: hydroxymethylbilane synthase [Bacteroidales bacterium]
MNITIGTRGSKLALWQSYAVKNLIEETHPDISVNIKTIQTKGDKILDVALSKIGDKNLFTKEIENQLHDVSIDIAVHSLKDLPTELPEGLTIGAVLPRAEKRDVLLSAHNKTLSDLTPNDTIATSSLRRRAALLAWNPDLHIIDIRGNIDTRIQKMENGYCDAIIMAAAGVQRLSLDHKITEFISENIITPAVSQGIIAIECRKNDTNISDILHHINDENTAISASAERAFLHAMHGGCQLPLGCVSSISHNTIYMNGFIATVDGKKCIKHSLSGPVHAAQTIGKQLADQFYSSGAQEILNTIL